MAPLAVDEVAASATIPSARPGMSAAQAQAQRRMLWRVAAIGVVTLAAALAFQGTRGLHETSEGRYALAAWELSRSHDWREPTLDGHAHWTKPPLTYWAIAAGMKVWGRNAWGVRVPGAIAHVITTLLIVAIAGSLLGPEVGVSAGWIYGLGWLPQAAAHTATADVFLTLFVTAAMTAFVRSVTARDEITRSRWIHLMWAIWGFGFLTKGPPALLPLLAIAAWRSTLPRPARSRWWTWAGGLAFALIGLGWYVVELRHHSGLLGRFLSVLFRDNLLGHNGHNSALWKSVSVFAPPLVLATGIPGLVAAATLFRRRFDRGWFSWTDRWKPRHPLSLLLFWALLPLAVFIVAGNKLPLYVLPLAAPLATITAAVLVSTKSRRILVATIVASASVMITAKGVFANMPSRRDMLALAHEVRNVESVPHASDATVVIATPERLYGLQFYLGKKLLRPARDATPEELETFVRDLANACRAGEFPHGLLFVLPRKDTALRTLLSDRAGSASAPVAESYWQVVFVPPPDSF